MEQERLAADLGWRLILMAAMANLVFKDGIAVVLGHRRLALRTLVIFGASIVGGCLILWLWPSEVVNQWIDRALS